MPLLIARGAKAFLEYAPMRPFDVRESQRVYRSYSYGPLLELFVIDMRSYRGPNTNNLQLTPSDETAFLGREQLEWLKAGLKNSRAVWKVVAADMPLGVNVGDGVTPRVSRGGKAVANGEAGGAKGRELEIAELLSHLKRRRVRNVVWLTADVHYCAAHYYDPARAAFRDFDPFWEFVAGPLNAGSFGPNTHRRHLRAAGRLLEGAAARTEQSVAIQRVAVLRRGEHRRRGRQHDRRSPRHQRRAGVHTDAAAAHGLISGNR